MAGRGAKFDAIVSASFKDGAWMGVLVVYRLINIVILLSIQLQGYLLVW